MFQFSDYRDSYVLKLMYIHCFFRPWGSFDICIELWKVISIAGVCVDAVSFSRLALSWWFSITEKEGAPHCGFNCLWCLKASMQL